MAADLEYFKIFTGKDDYDASEEAQIVMYLEIAEELILSYTNGVWASKTGSSVIANGRQAHIVRKYLNNQLGLTAEGVDGWSQAFDERAHEGLRLSIEDKKILDTIQSKKTITSISMHRNGGQVW